MRSFILTVRGLFSTPLCSWNNVVVATSLIMAIAAILWYFENVIYFYGTHLGAGVVYGSFIAVAIFFREKSKRSK